LTAEADAILIERFVATGDHEAFATIVKRYTDLVYAACRRVLGSQARAEEAAQETFLHLLRKADSVTGSLPAWLHMTATWKAIDAARKDSARRRREISYGTDRPMLETSRWEDISPLVDESLAELPQEVRGLLVEHFLKEKSQASLASEMGLSQPTVSRRISGGLEQLRVALRKRGVLVAAGVLSGLLAERTVEAAPVTLAQELGKMSMVAGAQSAGVAGTAVTVSGTAGAAAAVTAAVVAVKGKLMVAGLAAAITVGGVAGYKHLAGWDAPAPVVLGGDQIAATESGAVTEEQGLGKTVTAGADVPLVVSMGKLYAREAGYVGEDGWELVGPAVADRLVIPAGKELRLTVSPAEVRNLAGLDALAGENLHSLMLCNSGADDAAMRHVADLKSLQVLHVHGTYIGDVGAEYLRGLANLRVLHAGDTRIGNVGASYLAALPQLEWLDLSGTAVTDEAMVFVGRIGTLRELNLASTQVGSEGIAQLDGLVSLERLTLCRLPLDDRGLEHIGRHTGLKSICLCNTRITDAGLAHLAGLKSLRYLGLHGTGITDAAMAQLAPLTGLEELHLPSISDAGIAQLPTLPNLKVLQIDSDQVGRSGLEWIGTFEGLEVLVAGGSGVDDAGLAHVGRLTRLRTLVLGGTTVTGEGLASLRTLKDLVSFHLHGGRDIGRGLRYLGELPSLRTLTLDHLELGSEGLAGLREAPGLKELGVINCGLDSQSLQVLGSLRTLEKLIISDPLGDQTAEAVRRMVWLLSLAITSTNLTDGGLAAVAGLANLRSLTVNGTFTDEGLCHLPSMGGLESLNVQSPHLTPKGLETLQGMSGLKQLNFVGQPSAMAAGAASDLLPAPFFQIEAADGGELCLENYLGRLVVLHFWSADSGTGEAEVGILKQLHEQITGDARVAMISLHLGDDVTRPRDLAERYELAWPQAYVGPYSSMTSDYVVDRSCFVLVDPQGRLAARVDDPAELPAAILRTLGGFMSNAQTEH